MLIPDVETFILRTNTRDEYGKVITTEDITYWGVIERQTQFRGGSSTYVGEGMIFSSHIEGLTKVGDEILIDALIWTVKQVLELKDLGSKYHHTELLYG
jgi:hypothetical protein